MKNLIIIAHTANHAFRSAKHFDEKGYLNKIISIYPNFKIKKYNITKSKVKTLLIVTFFFIIKRILKFRISNKFFSDLFNFFAKKEISKIYNKNSIVVGLSGYCLQTINYAKKKGLVTIVDRACPHILTQKEIILNEIETLPILNKKHLKEKYFDNQIVDQMLKEYEECDFISVPSKFTLNSFKNFNLENKIIFNAIHPEKYFQISPINKKKNELVIFSLGFNFIRKGFYYLIEAMRKIEDYDIRLILRTNIPPYLNLKIPKNIQVISNHMTFDELEKMYNLMDVLILPSVDEGFGMVGLEAMRLKKPIIVTKNVGMKDILNNYMEDADKFIVKPRDIKALTDKIIELYDNKDELDKYGLNFYNAANIFLEKDIHNDYKKILGD